MSLRSGLPTVFVAVMVASSGLACAGQKDQYNPFVVPKDRIAGSVRAIALAPVVTPDEIREVDPGRARFDSLLTGALEAAGYTVIPAREAGAIWRRVTDSMGGFFDPATGQRDTVKFARARAATMLELREHCHADALLHPMVVFAPAKFDAGTASWDGTTQSYQNFGKKFLSALFGTETYGKTPALSFGVLLEDMEGETLYANKGGLQLYEIPSGNDFARVPARELYADPARNAEAVRLALAPLVSRAAPSNTTH